MGRGMGAHTLPKLDRAEAIALMQGALLVELFKSIGHVMASGRVEAFFDDFGLDLIPILDRQCVVQGLLEDSLVTQRSNPWSAGVDQFDPDPEMVYLPLRLVEEGLTRLRVDRRRPNSAISQYIRNGENWLQRRLEEIYAPMGESALACLPGAPDVDLDFDSDPILQLALLSKLDNLIDAVTASNAFRIGDAKNFAAVTSALNEAKSELKSGKTTIGRMEAIAFGACSFLAAKFAETIVGILATDFWSSLVAAIHSLA